MPQARYCPICEQVTEAEVCPTDGVPTVLQEVVDAVAGRSGFWRSQVRKEWFGCGTDGVADEDEDDESDEVDPCRQLDKVEAELKKWDGLIKQVQNLSERSAKRFMRKNERRMREFVARYVPSQASASGMSHSSGRRRSGM